MCIVVLVINEYKILLKAFATPTEMSIWASFLSTNKMNYTEEFIWSWYHFIPKYLVELFNEIICT